MLPVWVRTEIGSAGALGAIAGVGAGASVLGNLLGAWLGMPFGALLGGYAVEAFDLHTALLAFGAAYLLTMLAPVGFPSWRQMRRPERVAVDTAA